MPPYRQGDGSGGKRHHYHIHRQSHLLITPLCSPQRQDRRTDDPHSASPRRKKVRRDDADASIAAAAAPKLGAAAMLMLRDPPDVAELRRRILARSTDFSGLEKCPWAQSSGAMFLATTVGAADPVGARNHAVRWCMRAGNPHWFTHGLRVAVRGNQSALVHELLADTALWPARILKQEQDAQEKEHAKSSSSNKYIHRALNKQSAASRKLSPIWGPFSANYFGPPEQVDSDDGDDGEDEDEEEEEQAPSPLQKPATPADTPALLMLDALLHGNQDAAECIMRTFVPSSWQLKGRWRIGPFRDDAVGGDFVPTTVITLGKKRVHATAAVRAQTLAELMERVRQCLRAVHGKVVALVEEEAE